MTFTSSTCFETSNLNRRVVGKYEKGVEHPHKGQQKILRLLRIILIVALALGISAASMISGSADAGSASTMKDLRVANAVLVILAMGGAMVMTALFFVGNMTPRASLLVAGQGLCIVSRLVACENVYGRGARLSRHTKNAAPTPMLDGAGD